MADLEARRQELRDEVEHIEAQLRKGRAALLRLQGAIAICDEIIEADDEEDTDG